MESGKELKPKEQRFADEYIMNGRNATQAYLLVQPNSGYDNARTKGSQWVAKAHISRYINDKTVEQLNASSLRADDVLNELIKIGFGKKLKGLSKKTDKQTGEVEETEYEHTAYTEDRIKALELLGKNMSMWTDKVDANIEQQVMFVEDVPDDD